MSLKEKTIHGFKWSFIESFLTQFFNFVIGIILARLLSPRDFGLIGMLSIFLTVAATLAGSGLNQALIRKKDCADDDYSTAFYVNLLIGFFCFLILFASAGAIAVFFREPQLKSLLCVLAVLPVINSFGFVQSALLMKQLDFKTQAKISFIANTVAGAAGISMAFAGCGVWSLVAKSILQNLLGNSMLWLINRWKPALRFSVRSFKEMFGFGSKLLASSLIDTIFNNAYYFVIGRFFSSVDLGYYSRAEQFTGLISQNTTGSVQRVSYPSLATLQEDNHQLKSAYKKIVKSSMFVSCTIMLCLAASAKPLVLTLLGAKWQGSIDLLRMLAISGMLYPLHSLNLNILNIKGRSDLFLKLEIIKKILTVPIILIGVFHGLKLMVMCMVLFSFVAYFINSIPPGKIIGYSIREQLMDLAPSFLFASGLAGILWVLNACTCYSAPVLLTIQIGVALCIGLISAELMKLDEYVYLKTILKTMVRRQAVS
jgi:O-antigen/teichoic acid export membrane protein